MKFECKEKERGRLESTSSSASTVLAEVECKGGVVSPPSSCNIMLERPEKDLLKIFLTLERLEMEGEEPSVTCSSCFSPTATVCVEVDCNPMIALAPDDKKFLMLELLEREGEEVEVTCSSCFTPIAEVDVNAMLVIASDGKELEAGGLLLPPFFFRGMVLRAYS